MGHLGPLLSALMEFPMIIHCLSYLSNLGAREAYEIGSIVIIIAQQMLTPASRDSRESSRQSQSLPREVCSHRLISL